jgi:hypothetical protein
LATLLLTAYFARPTNGVIAFEVRLHALELSLSERAIADAALFSTPLTARFAMPFSARFCGMAPSPYIENRLVPSGAERDVFMTNPL